MTVDADKFDDVSYLKEDGANKVEPSGVSDVTTEVIGIILVLKHFVCDRICSDGLDAFNTIVNFWNYFEEH